MVSFPQFALLAFAALSSAAAPEANNSPRGIVYSAVFDKQAQGSLVFWSNEGAVSVGVGIEQLPISAGPFTYQINSQPVPANGDCAGTLQTFNPFNGTANASSPEEHKVGDLSGKHGAINGTSTAQGYNDRYLSLNSEDPAFIGGLSVVVRSANSTILMCTNITREKLHPRKGASKSVALFSGLTKPLAGLIAGLASLFGIEI